MSASAWDRAVEAAANVIATGDAVRLNQLRSDSLRRWYFERASAALAAALPVLLEELAQRIEAEERLPYAMQRYVRHADVRIVRGFAAEVTQ